MADKNTILVGSRKSELALIQTRYVISELKKENPDKNFEIITMSTLGDQVLDKPLPKIGEKSLFTKELEIALASGCVDFVVHSLKDLPTCLPDGMAIGAVLEREDPRDALVLREDLKGHSLSTLAKGSVIGTSSLRRTAQISRKHPHLVVESIRGNLNTRLRKLDESNKYSAIVLAQAGLRRMQWDHRISQVLDDHELLYAVGQGALAVECREDDTCTIEMLKTLQDAQTILRVLAERSFLKTLGGGCSAPVAVKSILHKEENNVCLELTGAVWSLDGSNMIDNIKKCHINLDTPIDVHEFCTETKCRNKSESLEKIVNDINRPINSNKRKCPVQHEEMPVISDFTQYVLGEKDLYVKNNVSKKQKICAEDEDPHANLSTIKVCPFMSKGSGDSSLNSLPIGVDFMGKCPYLDTEHKMGMCPVNAKIFTDGATASSSSPLKCPFLNKEIKPRIYSEIIKPISQTKNSDLFCGIIGCKTVCKQALQDAENLGIELAKSLINKGALNVMQEAQFHIHSTINDK